MAAWIPAAIAGTAALVGGHMRNIASAQAADKQMQFQREMSDTAYQRQVADLKAAGINPMLVSRLGGASSPVGSMPQFENIGAAAAQAFQGVQTSTASAQQAATQEELSKPQMELVKANTEQIKEATKNIPIEGERLRKTVELLFSQTVKTAQETSNLYETEAVIKQTVKKLKAETKLLDNQVEAEAALDNIGRTVKGAQPIVDVIKPFIGR
jgi:hypothetical protein